MSEMSETDERKSVFSSVLEPAVLITGFTAMLYFCGWCYVEAYFTRLGIRHDSLEFGTTYYLTEAIMPVTVSFALAMFVYVSRSMDRDRIFGALLANSPILALTILLLFKGVNAWFSWISFHYLVSAGVLLILYITLARYKIFLVDKIAKDTTKSISYIILVLGLVTMLVSFFLGSVHAEKMIDGTLHNVTSISVTAKKGALSQLNGKSLLLVLHKNKTFYLVEKTSDVPKFPKVYIIPESQIELAVLERIN